ncbi:hypothetical protein HDU87_006218 [Geranomyces variabilis]|uniref:UspA domain-containing protein n=1 Tax=Geranomyces variabilis TaxID=109894 RepID=A0AAD5XKL0_9FUNG|nr:hypothetical protein HDU87_006218 [Geranomyces variabilis]
MLRQDVDSLRNADVLPPPPPSQPPIILDRTSASAAIRATLSPRPNLSFNTAPNGRNAPPSPLFDPPPHCGAAANATPTLGAFRISTGASPENGYEAAIPLSGSSELLRSHSQYRHASPSNDMASPPPAGVLTPASVNTTSVAAVPVAAAGPRFYDPLSPMEDGVPPLVTPNRHMHRHRRSPSLDAGMFGQPETPQPLAGVTFTFPQPLHSPLRRPSAVREDVEMPSRRNAVPRYDPSSMPIALPEWPPPSHTSHNVPPLGTDAPFPAAPSSPRQAPPSAHQSSGILVSPPHFSSPPSTLATTPHPRSHPDPFPLRTPATGREDRSYALPSPLPPLPRLATTLHPLSASLPSSTASVQKQSPIVQQPLKPRRQTILIGIDGSMYANGAFDWAAVHLLAKGDNLIVARVLAEADVRAQYLADQAKGTRILEQELKNHASNLLNLYIPRLQRIAPQTSDVAVTAKIKIGRTHEVLCTLATELKASRLVIGSRGVAKRTSTSSNSSSLSPSRTTSQQSQQKQQQHPGAVARHCLARASVPVTCVLPLGTTTFATASGTTASTVHSQKFEVTHGGNYCVAGLEAANEAFYAVV